MKIIDVIIVGVFVIITCIVGISTYVEESSSPRENLGKLSDNTQLEVPASNNQHLTLSDSLEVKSNLNAHLHVGLFNNHPDQMQIFQNSAKISCENNVFVEAFHRGFFLPPGDTIGLEIVLFIPENMSKGKKTCEFFLKTNLPTSEPEYKDAFEIIISDN